ncbi:DoxX family protein [Mammaliicoccus sciuri]|uniref:DoxX family protein n=1 Tax=Mammaliicoccus sciuri TaxID=1296 RepID=UPI001E349228|nr:DoxX family protein [Mammaliicoccus sciuri]MCD8898504.1 DoxX family protein [Mammaliicoccus sciuri]
MNKGIVLIRIMLGVVFCIHGTQKILGGFEDPVNMMVMLNLPAFLGILLSIFEFLGGILIIFGIIINYISLGFILICIGALITVHLKEGYMASEFVLTLLMMSTSMILSYKWRKIVQFL